MSLIKDLVDIVGSDNFFDEPALLEQFSKDYSFVPPRKPRAIVKIKELNTLREIVKWANRTKTPLIPVSSGPPHFRGDTVPSTGGAVIIDLSEMKKIIKIDRRNRFTIIEPGVRFGELQAKLAEKGMKIPMPFLPASTKSVLTSFLEREPIMMPHIQWDLLDPLRCVHIIWGSGEELVTGEAGFQLGTLEEQWNRKQAQILPFGPGQWDPYRIVSAAQGTMGIVVWGSIRCELLPREYKLYFVTSEKLNDILKFANEFLRFRYGDETLFLNRWSLASILAKDASEAKQIAMNLPSWIFIFTLAGYDILPKERVKYQEEDVERLSQRFGVKPASAVSGISDREMGKLLSNPSKDPHWKIRLKGACQDIFFLTTIDKLPQFETIMHSMASEVGYPISEIGCYIQPQQHGVAWHCEFNLFYNPEDVAESNKVQNLLINASEVLMLHGAYFSRPYGIWADMVYSRDALNRYILKELKKIFDPNNIMNPGKLCF